MNKKITMRVREGRSIMEYYSDGTYGINYNPMDPTSLGQIGMLGGMAAAVYQLWREKLEENSKKG